MLSVDERSILNQDYRIIDITTAVIQGSAPILGESFANRTTEVLKVSRYLLLSFKGLAYYFDPYYYLQILGHLEKALSAPQDYDLDVIMCREIYIVNYYTYIDRFE